MSKLNNFENVRKKLKEILIETFNKNDLLTLETEFEQIKLGEFDQRSVLDQVFRDVLIEYLENDVDSIKLENFVSFCIETCRKNLTNATMPVVLLNDIFEALTLDKSEIMFLFVEQNVNVWKEEIFFSSCKNNLLRMCNDLLRRLSRSQNTVFCGRILLFLAKFFPFSERSGLNIISEFNLENMTEFGSDEKETNVDGLDLKMDCDFDEKPTPNVRIDYNLYCKFWALQDFFRNPLQIYNKVQWKTFQSHSTNVLQAFNSFKLDETYNKTIKNESNEISSSATTTSHYFAKYLTNQKLLELQLSDSNFRRYVLVQFLILFQYLSSSNKIKHEHNDLKSDQLDWIKEKQDMVYSLLAETPPKGRYFVKCIKHIMSREEHWINWKSDGCPEFKRPISQVVDSEENERKKIKRDKPLLGDMIRDATVNHKFIMGNSELTKLWNLCPNNLEACKNKERDFLPSLESFFAESISQLDNPIDEKEKRVKNTNFCWRALRLLSIRYPYFFNQGSNPIPKLSEYVEIMVKRIAEDKRGKSKILNNETGTATPEAEIEDELLKGSEVEDTNVDGNDNKLENEIENIDDVESSSKGISISREIIDKICQIIDTNNDYDWKKLAIKLGFQKDEVDFFASKHDNDEDRCRNALIIWTEDDDDPTVENLQYILEGLKMSEASEYLNEIIQQKNSQIVSD